MNKRNLKLSRKRQRISIRKYHKKRQKSKLKLLSNIKVRRSQWSRQLSSFEHYNNNNKNKNKNKSLNQSHMLSEKSWSMPMTSSRQIAAPTRRTRKSLWTRACFKPKSNLLHQNPHNDKRRCSPHHYATRRSKSQPLHSKHTSCNNGCQSPSNSSLDTKPLSL